MTGNKYDSHIIVAACFMIQAVGVGTFVTYGVFFNSLLEEFQWSRASLSGASSLAFILSGIFAIIIGKLNDIHGPRKLMSIASLLLGTGVILMSRLTELWQLFVFYGIIFGVGLGAIDVIALTTTARWFTRSRGFMTGIVKVGTGAGQFLIPFMASVLIASHGWRQAYVIIGISVTVILFGVAQLLRRDPESCNSMKGTIRNSQIQPSSLHDNSLSAEGAIHTIQFWILCGISVLTVFCLLTILVHIVPHASDLGLSARKAAGVLSTIGAVSMIGRFSAGVAIDRLGSKQIMVICFFILISGLLWLQIADNLWMLYLFAAVYGLAHGGFFTAISPIVAEVFGIGSHGAIFGIVVFSGTAGGAVGPLVAGRLFDMTGSYGTTFQLITILSTISLALIVFLKPINAPIKEVQPH